MTCRLGGSLVLLDIFLLLNGINDLTRARLNLGLHQFLVHLSQTMLARKIGRAQISIIVDRRPKMEEKVKLLE